VGSPTLKVVLVLTGLGLAAAGSATVATRVVAPLVIPPAPARPRPGPPQPDPTLAEAPDAAPGDAGVDADAPVLQADFDPAVLLAADGGPAGMIGPGPASGGADRVATSSGDIVKTGPGSYLIRRAAVEAALSKGGWGSTRATPVIEQGRVVGYRLAGVSGQLTKLGLRSGDVVTAINGQPLTSPEAAIRGYGGFRKTGRAAIAVRRGGGSVPLSYRLTE
jgi:hypothetical protein